MMLSMGLFLIGMVGLSYLSTEHVDYPRSFTKICTRSISFETVPDEPLVKRSYEVSK